MSKAGWQCVYGTCKRAHAWGVTFCWQHEKVKIKKGRTRPAKAVRSIDRGSHDRT